MADWQGVAYEGTLLSTMMHASGGVATMTAMISNANAAGAWPAANRALYMPVEVRDPVTAYQFAFIVGTSSGNYDIGIYDELGNRLVNKGSTGVPASGIAVTNITDTALTPGVYFIGMNVDNTTCTIQRTTPGVQDLWSTGMGQQAVGAVTLPDPFTWAAPASAYIPLIWLSTLQATI